MKRLLILITALTAWSATPDGGSYTISGDIANLTGPITLYINMEPVGTVETSDGKFVFSGKTDGQAIAHLYKDERIFHGFMFEPGNTNITGDWLERGSISSDSRLEAIRQEAGAEMNATLEQFSRNASDSVSLAERRLAVTEKVREIMERNLDNMVGAMYLGEYLVRGREPNEIMADVARFPDDMQKNLALTMVRDMVTGMLWEQSGSDACRPIVMPDRDGVERPLADVLSSNRYVLVDFWASWCPPCVAEIPHLKELYARHRENGFEIYGVSGDRNREDWTGAIQKYEMGWINVSCLKGPENCQSFIDYAIRKVPSNFLISSDGRIVARNLHGDELEKTLDELFDKK